MSAAAAPEHDELAEAAAAYSAELGRLRRERGLTKMALARRMSYHSSYVTKVENGALAPTEPFTARAEEVLDCGGALWARWQAWRAARWADMPEEPARQPVPLPWQPLTDQVAALERQVAALVAELAGTRTAAPAEPRPRPLDGADDDDGDRLAVALVGLCEALATVADWRRSGGTVAELQERVTASYERARAARRGGLVARRRALGMSQADLAERVGVERSTVARCEQGTSTPRPWYRPLWAEALAVTPEEFDELLSAGSRGRRTPRSLGEHAATLAASPVELAPVGRPAEAAGGRR